MNTEKKENIFVFKLNFGYVILLCKNENFKFLNIESFPFFLHSEVHFCSIFLDTEKFSFFSYSWTKIFFFFTKMRVHKFMFEHLKKNARFFEQKVLKNWVLVSFILKQKIQELKQSKMKVSYLMFMHRWSVVADKAFERIIENSESFRIIILIRHWICHCFFSTVNSSAGKFVVGFFLLLTHQPLNLALPFFFTFTQLPLTGQSFCFWFSSLTL